MEINLNFIYSNESNIQLSEDEEFFEWDFSVIETSLCYSSSLVFDSVGTPYVSYIDINNKALKLAHWTGSTWNIEIVYDDGLTAGWGRCASLAFDDWDHPGIAFKYMNSGQPYNQWGLGYAHWNGNIWNIMVPEWGFGTGAHCSLKYNGEVDDHIKFLQKKRRILKYVF